MCGEEEREMCLPQGQLKKLIMSAGGRCSMCRDYLLLFDSGKTVTLNAAHISENFDKPR